MRTDIFAASIKQGEVVLYPTESFYALGVDATNSQAIRQLFCVKHREPGRPIALIAANLSQVKKYFVMSQAELWLAKKHWPGAVTILLKPKKKIAAGALAPLSSSPSLSFPRRGVGGDPRRIPLIGIRVPAHAQARVLALQAGAPITATSANLTDRPPTKSARKVKKDFPGILLLPGRCGRQVKPSTVIALRHNRILIIRQGSVHV